MSSDTFRQGPDPTKAVLSKSKLNKKALCDYVINVATGCSHGCKFCYVPSTPTIRTRPDMLKEHVDVDEPQQEWGNYVLYRDDLHERLADLLENKRQWKETRRGRGVVGVSFGTDPYMNPRAGRISRGVLSELTDHERYVRVQTRNPMMALTNLPTFRDAGKFATIGTSIPSMDDKLVSSLEVNAPPPTHRLRGLRKFAEAGVQVYVSMSPTYPTDSREDLRDTLAQIKSIDPAVVFHEPINHRGGNFDMMIDAANEAGENALAESLESVRTDYEWAEYAFKHLRWVQEIGEELDLPVHLWPDRKLLDLLDGDRAEWVSEWLDRQSPEPFADREPPDTDLPSIPAE